MSARSPEEDAGCASRPLRRKWVWLGYAVLLVASGIAASVMVDRWLPRLVEGELRESAAARGIQLEAEQAAFGWSGGRSERLRVVAGDFWRLEAERAQATWSPWQLIRGQLDGLSLESVEANIDLGRLWPPPELAIPSDAPVPQSDPELPSPGLTLAPQTPEILSPEDSKTPAPVEKQASPLAEYPERTPWWRDLPLKSLLLPEARIRATYGEAVWPLLVSLNYADDHLKSEARLTVADENLDLHISARELSNATGWTAQGALQWRHPLKQLSAFFPESHPAHPAQWNVLGIQAARLDAVQAEAVVRGTNERWDEMGLLVEGGPAAFDWEGGELALNEWILAARGAPDSLEVNSGLAVSRWRHGPWSADDFQLSFERSASGKILVETPHVKWTHALGWSGEATARHFSYWPKRQGREQVDEVQIAFSQASNPFFALRQFRFFINLRDGGWDGRLSALETQTVADWAIVNTRLQGLSPAPGVSEVSIDATLEHTPQARSVVRILGNARKESEGTRSVGTLRTPDGVVLATWFADWATQQPMRLRAAELWQFEKVLPWLSTASAAAQGWNGSGLVDWQLTASVDLGRKIPAFNSQLTARLDNVTVKSVPGGWALQGLNGVLRLEANPFPRSRGLQALRLDSVHLGGVEWRDLDFQFSWPMWNRVQVEKVKARWLGGTLAISPFSINPHLPRFQMRIALVDLDAGEARKVFSLPENLSGRLEGMLLVSYENGYWRWDHLRMRSLVTTWQVDTRSHGERFETFDALVHSLGGAF